LLHFINSLAKLEFLDSCYDFLTTLLEVFNRLTIKSLARLSTAQRLTVSLSAPKQIWAKNLFDLFALLLVNLSVRGRVYKLGMSLIHWRRARYEY